jgi:hypothetical protein
LLSGIPTETLSTEARRNLDALVPKMIAEAKRRKIVIDAKFEVPPDGA